MKTITITVEVDGNSVGRTYVEHPDTNWQMIIEDMLDTLERSDVKEF